MVNSAENFFAVFKENFFPESGVACGDACAVPQSGAGEVAPVGVLGAELGAQNGGEGVGEVADVGDDFVVLVRGECYDFHAEGAPEGDDAFGWLGWGVGHGGDETGALVEKVCPGVFESGFFRACHGVGADEVCGAVCEGLAGLPTDECFGAADVCDEGVWLESRCDLRSERGDGFDGGAEYDKVCLCDGLFGGVADLIAPGLGEAFLSCLWSA